ncbi:hypothetical protein ACWEQJ_14880 [Streptomyces cyaneofuscatus]
MHSRIPTRRLAASGIVGVAALAALAPAASAMDATGHPSTTQAVVQAEAKLAPQLTVKSYTTYLKQQKTPEAKKTLDAFSKLPAGKQVRFVKYLQNRDIYKALMDQAKGSVGRKLKVVAPYNQDIKFVTEVTAKTLKGKVARSGHTGVATASTVWKAVPRVKSFGKGVDKVQEVTADTRTWKAKLAKR